MRNTAKTEIAIFAFLMAVPLFVSSSAFPQGGEYERSRTGVLNAGQQGVIYGGQPVSDYQLSPGDLINILLWREGDLSRQVRIRPDGRFSYPLIGTVDAAGLTVDQLQEVLRKEFLKYVKYPEVTVEVIESAAVRVLVLGEVNYPGVYGYKGASDVLTAIGLAGDFTPNAKRESVIIITDNFTDHPKARRVNVFGSFYRGTKGNNFMLNPGDVVYVPKTFIADWNKTILDIQPTISTLLGNYMNTRTDIKTLYFNRDKPVKPVQNTPD